MADITSAGRNLGIVPGDPAYEFVRFMVDMSEEQIAQQAKLVQRLDTVVQEATTIAGGKIADTAARELTRTLPEAIRSATFYQHRRWFLTAALVLVAISAACGGGGFFYGRHVEAEKYIDVPAQLKTALTGSEAAEWINLIRLNHIGIVNKNCFSQAGSLACSYVFWTEMAPPQ